MLLTFFDDAPVVPCPVSTPTAEYQTVTFVADDGATLSARYIRPVGNKRVPTVLMFHDAGRPVRGWHHMTRFVALGYAVFALENRAEADAQTQFADAQAAARAALSLPTTLNLITWGRGPGRHARDCRRRQTASACCQMRGAEPALHGRICRLCAICRAARLPAADGHIRHGHDRPAGRAKRRL